MKFILLILVLLTTLLYAKTQIVIGTFSKAAGANVVKNDLDSVINQDSEFKKLLEENSIKSLIKKDGKYLIVVLEPFLDKKIQNTALEKIRQTKFKDAYILELKEEVKQVNNKVEDTKVDKLTPAEVKTKKVQEKKDIAIKQDNFVLRYMTEIIIVITILILAIAYIFILKNRQNKLQNEIEEIDKVDEIKQTDNFDHEDDVEDILKLKSTIVKKDVPLHGKISKEDFKEFNGFRIIIAEDNLINQKVIKGLLSESGIDLTILNDGQEVLNYLEKDDAFCMILMDIHMPNMNGFEATKAIRQNPKYSHITVIALSGDIASDDIENMDISGMQENLEKPLSMDSLYDVLYAYGYIIDASKTLDTKIGIEVCGGDEDFYKEILNDFLNSYEDSTKKIQDSLDKEDFESAQKMLLDISGITANIGALKVQESLIELKQKLHNSQKHTQAFKKYASDFDYLIFKLREYLS